MFGFQRRGVRRCECDTLLPKPGPLPHTSQTEDTGLLQFGKKVRQVSRQAKGTPVVEGYPTNRVRREPGARTVRAGATGTPPSRPRDPCADQPANGGAAYPGGVMRVAATTSAATAGAATAGAATAGAATRGAATTGAATTVSRTTVSPTTAPPITGAPITGCGHGRPG